MIKINTKLKVPNNQDWVKEYINEKTGEKSYSFLYNVSKNVAKDGDSPQWEVEERYNIIVSNIQPIAGSTLNLDTIQAIKQVKSKSRNGQIYYNVKAWIKASCVQVNGANMPNTNAYNNYIDHSNIQQQSVQTKNVDSAEVDESDLPF